MTTWPIIRILAPATASLDARRFFDHMPAHQASRLTDAIAVNTLIPIVNVRGLATLIDYQ